MTLDATEFVSRRHFGGRAPCAPTSEKKYDALYTVSVHPIRLSTSSLHRHRYGVQQLAGVDTFY